MSAPQVFVDYEFGFQNGQVTHVTLLQGRDTAGLSDDLARLELHTEPGLVEVVIINLKALAYQRMLTRTIQPETTLEDSRTKLVDHGEQ